MRVEKMSQSGSVGERRGVQGIALKPNQGANLALSSAPHVKKESRDILVIGVP